MTYYMTKKMYHSIMTLGTGTLDKAGVIAYINRTFGFRGEVTDIRLFK